MARSRAVVVVTLVAATSVGGSLAGWWTGRATRVAAELWQVTAVVDGDTIEVAHGDRTDTVRFLGVDTPETKHPERGVECFGPEAAAYTAASLTGRTVRLEGDTEPRDRYGRRLAYVHVDGVRFNDELLRAGYARLLVIEPNIAHARTMLALELGARAAGRGLWSACGDAGSV